MWRIICCKIRFKVFQLKCQFFSGVTFDSAIICSLYHLQSFYILILNHLNLWEAEQEIE